MTKGTGTAFSEEDLLPLSALQHLVFCERQCALIHLEGVWRDNALTIQGSVAHQRVDDCPGESRGDLRIARGLALRSLRLGLTGRADVVEFHRDPAGARVQGLQGRWRVFPVEYKRGQPKLHRGDEVQLCAQGICLEEMLGTEVERGALFYGRPRRRTEVDFVAHLRQIVEQSAARLHDLLREGRTPLASYEPKCDACSLLEICRPKTLGRSAAGYVSQSLEGIRLEEQAETT